MLPSGRQWGGLPDLLETEMPHTVSIPHWLVDLCASYSKILKFHRQLFGWGSLRNSLNVCSLNLNPKPTSANGPRGPLPFSLDDLTGKQSKSVSLYSFLLHIHLLSPFWIYKACGWGLGWVCVCKSLNCVWLFVIPWTLASQVPLSMGFSGQEYWSGLPFPSPE